MRMMNNTGKALANNVTRSDRSANNGLHSLMTYLSGAQCPT